MSHSNHPLWQAAALRKKTWLGCRVRYPQPEPVEPEQFLADHGGIGREVVLDDDGGVLEPVLDDLGNRLTVSIRNALGPFNGESSLRLSEHPAAIGRGFVCVYLHITDN